MADLSKELLALSDDEFDRLVKARKDAKAGPSRLKVADGLAEWFSSDKESMPEDLRAMFTDKAGRFVPHRLLKVQKSG